MPLDSAPGRGSRADRARVSQDLPLSSEGTHRGASPPGVGGRHLLPPDGALVPLSGRGDGLVQPQGARLTAVQCPHGDFCVEAVEDAFAHFGSPEVFNTDQGAQFTVYQHGVHRHARGGRSRHPHGRQGAVGGPRVRGAAVEECEV